MAAPQLTEEQRMEALAKASKARHERHELLAVIKAGTVDPAGVLMRKDHDEVVDRTRVEAFVRAWPGYGESKARMFMYGIGISPRRRIGGLGVRQRRALLDALAGEKSRKA